MQGVQGGPDNQVQQQQRGKLVEIANEALRRQPPQAKQGESAPQIPEQPGAQAVRFQGTRGQLRIFRSRSMSFS